MKHTPGDIYILTNQKHSVLFPIPSNCKEILKKLLTSIGACCQKALWFKPISLFITLWSKWISKASNITLIPILISLGYHNSFIKKKSYVQFSHCKAKADLPVLLSTTCHCLWHLPDQQHCNKCRHTWHCTRPCRDVASMTLMPVRISLLQGSWQCHSNSAILIN